MNRFFPDTDFDRWPLVGRRRIGISFRSVRNAKKKTRVEGHNCSLNNLGGRPCRAITNRGSEDERFDVLVGHWLYVEWIHQKWKYTSCVHDNVKFTFTQCHPSLRRWELRIAHMILQRIRNLLPAISPVITIVTMKYHHVEHDDSHRESVRLLWREAFCPDLENSQLRFPTLLFFFPFPANYK